jgi:L-ascorbate metabolism protein UlaG (beta-lactamase superfamily)
MLRYLLKTMPPDLYHRDPGSGPVRIEYLGTAGFVLHSDHRTIVLDPYVSRPGLFATVFSRLVPDEERIRTLIPRADDVLIGHSHHDHVLDAPALCQQTGARFIGSVDACNVARAAGLPEDQMVQTEGRHDIACGQTCVVRGLPAAHGRVFFNRVTSPGTIDVPPSWPPRLLELRHGLVLNWFVQIAGLKVVHIDSAEFFEEELKDVTCDVLCLCAIGRAYRPNYVADAVRLLSPKYVIPCHWDLFTTPIEQEPLLLPTVDIQGFLREIEDAGATPILMPMRGSWSVGPDEHVSE